MNLGFKFLVHHLPGAGEKASWQEGLLITHEGFLALPTSERLSYNVEEQS